MKGCCSGCGEAGRVPAAATVGTRVVGGGRTASGVAQAPRAPTGPMCPELAVLTAWYVAEIA